ncbi:MAG TPA: TIR domain-containing protein [Chthoniobacterales bacterium]|jgi:uncharacterized protein YecT (DUF1311 family)|nr:TIR domain-containing protein [Chthoniobacterales bacterium]
MNSISPDPSEAGTAGPVKRDYWCFISYRHADNKEPGRQWATWLHQALETYEVPTDLIGTKNERGDTIPDRIFPVFRDEEELPADAQLSNPIETALRRSRFLVVLCSPRAAQSRFVAEEILTFKNLGKKDRILAAIIDGEPNASDDPSKGGVEKECFPQPLRFEVDEAGRITPTRTEPIAADFRLANGTPGWTTPAPYRESLKKSGLPENAVGSSLAEFSKQQNLMLLKIVAGVLGIPLGVLTKRDKAYQLEKQRQRARVLRRWLVALAVLALLTIGSAIWAWQKQREAVAAAQLAEERQYLSGIQAAAAQLADGNFTAARQSLITLPKAQRHREWALLMEWAGAPILRVADLERWMKEHEKDQPKLVSQIQAAANVLKARELLPADDPARRPTDMKSPDGAHRVIVDHYAGRHGTGLWVVGGGFVEGTPVLREDDDPSNNPSVLVRLSTENYGGIHDAVLTPDGSILVVELVDDSILREYSEPPLHDLGDKEGTTYIIPLPNRFLPAKGTPADSLEKSGDDDKTPDKDKPKSDTSDSDTSENETTDTETNDSDTSESDKESTDNAKAEAAKQKTTIRVAARHGRDVTAHVRVETADGESELSAYRQQRPWPSTPGRPVISDATGDGAEADAAGEAGGSQVDVDLLPDRVRLHASRLLKWEEGKPKRALAAVRSGRDGTEGLFFVAGGPAFLERWNLDTNELLGQLGPAIKPGEYDFSDMVDWGGAYNADGTRLFVLPEAADENNSPPQIYDVTSGKLIQTLPDISFAGGKARGASPLFGFSFSGKHIYASILERVTPGNDIWIAEKRENGYVPLEQNDPPPVEPSPKEEKSEEEKPDKRDPDRPMRFVAWSPDDAWRYYVSDEGETLRVISSDGASRHSIPNAVRKGAYPVFDQLSASAEKSEHGRYGFGGLIFARSIPQPILRLPVEWIDPEMRSLVVRNGVGNFDLITGSLVPGAEQPIETAAMLLLKWWIATAEIPPKSPAAASQAKPQASPTTAAAAATPSPISPAPSAAPTQNASVTPASSPSPSLTASIQVSPSPKASPAATPVSQATLAPKAVASPSASAAASSTVSETEADAALNTAYTALRKSLGKAAKQKLMREQVAWLKERDAIAEPAARLKLIQQRTAELKRRIGR